MPLIRGVVLAVGPRVLFVVVSGCKGLLLPWAWMLGCVFFRAAAFSYHRSLFGFTLLVSCDVELQKSEDALNGVGDTVDCILHVLLGEGEPKLLEELLIQGVPVVGLLRQGMRSTIIVKLYNMRHKSLHYFGHEHYSMDLFGEWVLTPIREVSRDVPFRAR